MVKRLVLVFSVVANGSRRCTTCTRGKRNKRQKKKSVRKEHKNTISKADSSGGMEENVQ